MVAADDKQECRDERMKDDRNRTAKPSLIRTAVHPDDVKHDHRPEINITQPDDRSACPRTPRIDERPRTVGYSDGDPDHQREHDNLTGEQYRIWKQAGLPLLHRREPSRCAHDDDDLAH